MINSDCVANTSPVAALGRQPKIAWVEITVRPLCGAQIERLDRRLRRWTNAVVKTADKEIPPRYQSGNDSTFTVRHVYSHDLLAANRLQMTIDDEGFEIVGEKIVYET